MTDARTDTDELTDLAARLVQIESENPPGNERACASFIDDWFEDAGIASELIANPDPDRPSVAARVGTGQPTLILNGHIDVVPVDDANDWRFDPYGGHLEGGRLYGRGSADMKTALAVAMLTARDLRDHLDGDTGSLIVHAAAGEETGYPGTAALIDAGYTGDMAIVLEPTGLRVATRAKGVSTFRLTIGGESAHASRPDQGDNPIDAIPLVLDEVDAYDDRLRAKRDLLCGQAYATVTEVSSGVGQNMAVIPDRASLLLDRRLLPGESFETVESEVDALCDRLHEIGVPVSSALVQHYESSMVDDESPVVKMLQRQTDAITELSTAPIGLEAATDARVLAATGIDAVIWGPGSLEQAHTVDEWISIDEAATAQQILRRTARELVASSP